MSQWGRPHRLATGAAREGGVERLEQTAAAGEKLECGRAALAYPVPRPAPELGRRPIRGGLLPSL